MRDDGARVTASYLIPRTKDDLRFRREGIKHVARSTWGTHGRGIDMIATLPLGMLGELPSFKRECPEFAENIHWYLKHAEENNIHLGETIVDPQGFRSRAAGTSPETRRPSARPRASSRRTRRASGSAASRASAPRVPQANELILGSFHPPLDEESFWVYVPVDSPGLKMFCREVVHRPGSSAYEHPLTSRGEEIESIVAFDNLFVPNERIMAKGTRSLHGVNFYNVWARLEHWYTFVRIVAKSEMYVGLAQLIMDTLELSEVPVVRQRVADIIEYCQILQGMQLAAEDLAQLSEGDLMIPDVNVVTAGRSYALDNLPRILHILQDICGQGMILRWSEKDLETPAAFGKNLGWFLDTRNMSARDKNLVMNLVWDVAASEHATRSKLFEESNALNVPFLKERLYGEYDRSKFLEECRHFIGLGPAPERTFTPHIQAPSLSSMSNTKGDDPFATARRQRLRRRLSMSDEQARRVYDGRAAGAELRARVAPGGPRRGLHLRLHRSGVCRSAPTSRRGLEATAACSCASRGELGVPVIFTTIAFEPRGQDAGLWPQKFPAIARPADRRAHVEIDPPRSQRRDDETVVLKKGASAFFGTNLTAILVSLQGRHGRPLRRDDERVHPRHCHRPPAVRLPGRSCRASAWATGRAPRTRQPLRHPGEVRRRRRARGRDRLPRARPTRARRSVIASRTNTREGTE